MEGISPAERRAALCIGAIVGTDIPVKRAVHPGRQRCLLRASRGGIVVTKTTDDPQNVDFHSLKTVDGEE